MDKKIYYLMALKLNTSRTKKSVLGEIRNIFYNLLRSLIF